MFDTDTLRVFASRFPTLSLDQVTEAANWVTKLHAREHLDNPSAVLESILQKRANAMHSEREPRTAPSSLRHRQRLDDMSEDDRKASDDSRRTHMGAFYAKHAHLLPLHASEPEA